VTVLILPVENIGEIMPGDDLAGIIVGAAAASAIDFEDGDVVVATSKVISKAEGALRVIDPADGSSHRRIIEEESLAVLRRRGELVISETRHGFVCANAGVDRSNVASGQVVLLPHDPDASAHGLRVRLQRLTGRELAVVITDTFGRAWRRGLTDVAIGVAGMLAIDDMRGQPDHLGRILEVTEVAVADEIAAAADLVMGKSWAVPVAIVRGYAYPKGEGRATDLVRPPAEDLFR